MPVLRKILCPVDLSGISHRALEYAVALAGAFDAQVEVLQVLDLVEPGRDDELRRRGLDELDRFARPMCGNRLAACVVSAGAPAVEILRAASADRADLIVMGTHGRSGFERFALGSVTERVLRQAQCPVMAIPPVERAVGPVPFRTIVCAMDFGESSRRGLEFARRVAAADAHVELVHVVEWPFGSGGAPLPREIEALRDSLEHSALEHLRRFTATTEHPRLRLDATVATGKPYIHILRRARERSADLIVVGLHSHATSQLALLGSTARRVLLEAPCPVLTVRA